VSIELANTDLELLGFAKVLLLRMGFRPGSIRLNVPKGKRTSVGIARKNCWLMTMSKKGDVRRFVDEVGFADSGKQNKIVDAIDLLAKLGSHKAADAWLDAYGKAGRKWVRRGSPTTSSR
jgi:hypothetical protein